MSRKEKARVQGRALRVARAIFELNQQQLEYFNYASVTVAYIRLEQTKRTPVELFKSDGSGRLDKRRVKRHLSKL